MQAIHIMLSILRIPATLSCKTILKFSPLLIMSTVSLPLCRVIRDRGEPEGHPLWAVHGLRPALPSAGSQRSAQAGGRRGEHLQLIKAHKELRCEGALCTVEPRGTLMG